MHVVVVNGNKTLDRRWKSVGEGPSAGVELNSCGSRGLASDA